MSDIFTIYDGHGFAINQSQTGPRSMSEMIERVARAICKLNHDEYISNDPDFIIQGRARVDGKPIVTWKLFEDQARAAIEAMREPTEEMSRAGFDESPHDCGGCRDQIVSDKEWMDAAVLAPYQAMIDAALREKVDA